MEHFNVYGLKVSNFSIDEIELLFDQTIESENNLVIFGHSLGFIPVLKLYPDLYKIINQFDLLVCDGTQFNWLCYFSGFKLKTVMSIPDISNYALQYANIHKSKVLLFGASSEINRKASNNLSKKYPQIQFCEGIDGYFNVQEEQSIVQRINDANPDFLLIGISSPIKERFANTYKQVLKANIIIPCGGMIDVYAGKTRQSPRFVKKYGFATLFRIIQEPRRLLKLHTWMVYETIFKFLPIVVYNKILFKSRKINAVEKYLSKK